MSTWSTQYLPDKVFALTAEPPSFATDEFGEDAAYGNEDFVESKRQAHIMRIVRKRREKAEEAQHV